MSQAIIPALFGFIFLVFASEAIRTERATLRGMHFTRQARPKGFWMVVVIYVVMSLFSLAGAAWICLLSAKGF